MRVYFESLNDQAWICRCLGKLEIMMRGKKWVMIVFSGCESDVQAIKAHNTSAQKIITCQTQSEVIEAQSNYVDWKQVTFRSLGDFDVLFDMMGSFNPKAVNSNKGLRPYDKNSIAIVLVCHNAYLKFLPEAIRSIERQSAPPKEKVLVLDGCTMPSGAPPSGWKVIHGNWGNPNPARNAGIKATKSRWLVFFDADNAMPTDYIAAVKNSISAIKPGQPIGFVYPDIQYCDEQLRPTRLLRVPEFGYWRARECTSFDTSAAWSRSALEMAGGWDDESRAWDDFRLVLKLSRFGWQGQRLMHHVFMREHKVGQRRSTVDVQVRMDESFHFFTLTILTLLAGRVEVFDDLIKTLKQLKIPKETSLLLVDNSGSDEFHKRILNALPALFERYRSINILREGMPYKISRDEPYLTYSRHFHVANLYAKCFQQITTDRLLILEDDMIPPVDGLKMLSDELFTNSKIGAVGGIYRSASHPDRACAAMHPERWQEVPAFEAVPNRPIGINFIGGGFTLYNMGAVRKAFPIMVFKEGSYLMGWDGNLSREIRRHGYSLVLHGGVRVEHNAWGIRRKEDGK